MKNNLNPLYFAVKSGLGAVTAMGLAAVPFAVLAQDADTDEDEIRVTEEVIVTGSRIARADIDSASPVTVLTREELEVTGLSDVGQLLQRMPSMSGSPIGTTTNNGGNGAVTIDLRGMGAVRTVTLVNGQRVVDGGDYQTIPQTLIERVEILKDGASAIYGADAVAGVVNIITRRDFEGLEFSVQTADWFDTDAGKQDTVGFIAGFSSASGNFVFGAEFVNQEEAYQADTPWEFMYDSYYIYPEGCEAQLTAPYTGSPSGGCYRSGSSAIPAGRVTLLDDGGIFLVGTPSSSPYEAGTLIRHDGRNYNYAPVNYLQTPYERTNIFAEGHFEITENVRFNGELRANFRTSAQELAPTPYFSLTDPAYMGFWDGASYNGVSEDNYYLRQAIDNYNSANGYSEGDDDFLAYQPGRDLRRRMFEQPRRFTQEINQYQLVAELVGEIGDMDWQLFMNRGVREREDQDIGQYTGARLSDVFGPSADLNGDGMPECYSDVNDPATLIAGCVPLNFFGGGEVDRMTGQVQHSTVTEDMFNYISFILNDSFLTEQELYGASLTGDLFELPGGPMGWAVGGGYWKQHFKYTPDSGKSAGAVSGNKSSPTEGFLTNNSLFLELLAPVLDNGEQELVLKAGFRWDDYDELNSDDTTWQFGVEFRPSQTLKLRATAGEVFRAPTITNLYGGLLDSFPTFSDPCAPPDPAPNCAGVAPGDEGQLLERIGGNPFLQPETGDTLTVGMVWTPDWGENEMTFIVDYWDIDLEDGISRLGIQSILDGCYEEGLQNYCQLITRRPADYGIANVVNGPLNVAEQGAHGVDTEIRWSRDTNSGRWEASMLWSHLMERRKVAFPGDAEQDLSGRYTDPTAADGGAYAEDKVNLTLQWARGDWSLGLLTEYISSLEADTFCNCGDGNRPDGSYIQEIDSLTYHDLVATYSFEDWGLRLQAGVTNLTDEEPPFIEVGFNATTDPPTYRLFGRGYYVRLGWEF
jgi:iron complex outermembrane receptor protein